jgi:hypothetical protein
MKTKSPLLIAIGALALFVLVALPSPTARAVCGQSDDVIIYYEYEGPTGVQIEMEVEWPVGATIFYTTNGSNPTHDTLGNPGSNTLIYYGPIFVGNRSCVHVRARAWKSCYYDSVTIADDTICNPIR